MNLWSLKANESEEVQIHGLLANKNGPVCIHSTTLYSAPTHLMKHWIVVALLYVLQGLQFIWRSKRQKIAGSPINSVIRQPNLQSANLSFSTHSLFQPTKLTSYYSNILIKNDRILGCLPRNALFNVVARRELLVKLLL